MASQHAQRTSPHLACRGVSCTAHQSVIALGRADKVQAFLERYQLSGDLVAAVRHGPIGDGFFEALEAISRAHENCRALVAEHGERVAVEMLEATALHEEAAMDRLCKWLARHCGGDPDEASAPHASRHTRHHTTDPGSARLLFPKRHHATDPGSARLLFPKRHHALSARGAAS